MPCQEHVFDNRRERIFLKAAFAALICTAGLVQVGVDFHQGRTPQAAEVFAWLPTRANLRAFEADLQDNCWLAQRLRPYVQYAQFAVLRDLGNKAVVGENGWLFYKPAVQYLIEPWPPAGEPWQPKSDEGDVVSAVISFKNQLAERGIHLLVVPAPNKASVYPDMLTKRASQKGEPVNAKTIELMRRLQQAGVEVVDLFSLFRQAGAISAAGDVTRYYLAQDSHWSPDGVRLAAEAIARRLVDSGWVQKPPTEYALKSATIERYGDILQMVQVPQIEKQFKPERLDCTQVVNSATNQPYHNDPNSQVLVLGDSFLRIYSQNEPGGAGLVEHLAYELGFALAAIINDGGASTLVRQQLSRNPKLLANKKVIVWEFVERDIRFGAEGWQIVPLP